MKPAITALAAFSSLVAFCALAHANGGACAKRIVTNIHHACANPGANCGAGCVCRDITNGFWSDCRCLKEDVTEGVDDASSCGGGTRWWVKKTGSLAAIGDCAIFDLVAHPSNRLDIFELAQIGDNGRVEGETAAFTGGVMGSFEMCVADMNEETAFLIMTTGEGTFPSVPIMGFDTGPNQIDSLGELRLQMDLQTGQILSLQPIPVQISNPLFEVQATLSVALSPDEGDLMVLLMTGDALIPHDLLPQQLPQQEIFVNDAGCRIVAAGADVRFEGCNLHVLNGVGRTDSLNGRGNLVVGYNEGPESLDRSGSHNLVTGVAHRYSSYGGVVFGRANRLLAPWAAVLGGLENTANRAEATVAGGRQNTASGRASTVAGGYGNRATGRFSLAAGGQAGTATGDYGLVWGGVDILDCLQQVKDAVMELAQP